MRTLRFGAAVAFVTVAFLSGAAASAHHSRAGYDQAKDKLGLGGSKSDDSKD